ncbi:DUF5131 family protein [Polyangium jinanense]|uniref:DUF5131 family protein n=1 Tax=Polyangium jinanense TaxID=2829994 RepID=A0A9X3XAW7_9BACT|nr:DUF5131 family protein [Polyangium jinanense]MDC3985935.1 DUF5131 family protein [Polyangium jinanense]
MNSLSGGVAWPRNLWAGTSVTSAVMIGRIEPLLRVGDTNTLRFLPVELQVEAIDLGEWLPQIDLVIQGGESGKDARPFDVEVPAGCAMRVVPRACRTS